MHLLETLPLFQRLDGSKSVLIAGAGGGFDVYAGLPIALALHARGTRVHLANLTFSYLGGAEVNWLAPDLAEVTPRSESRDEYFPERTLATWLASRNLPSTVHAFDKVGVRPLRAAYQALIDHLAVDAVVLIDGGTDILMRGDEAGLGTPEEDMASLAAVAGLAVPTRLVVCIGFGIDAFHGVCHAHFLENVAALDRDGAYLGAFSVSRTSTEGAAFLDAVAHAQETTPSRPSIVNGSIAAAIRGEFGNAQFTRRTQSSELFINPHSCPSTSRSTSKGWRVDHSIWSGSRAARPSSRSARGSRRFERAWSEGRGARFPTEARSRPLLHVPARRAMDLNGAGPRDPTRADRVARKRLAHGAHHAPVHASLLSSRVRHLESAIAHCDDTARDVTSLRKMRWSDGLAK